MAQRDRIFPTDTYPIALECRKPDPARPNDSRGLPVTPLSAKIRLLDSATETFLEIGGPGVTVANASITPQSGSQYEDTGGIVSYVVGAAWTAEPKDLVLYVQATFPDGYILTEDRRIKVLEFR